MLARMAGMAVITAAWATAPAASAGTITVPVTAHLDAQLAYDPNGSIECPNDERGICSFPYRVTGTFSGDLNGTMVGGGREWLTTEPRTYGDEYAEFTGTVKRCGTGSFIYDADVSDDGPVDVAALGYRGNATWAIRPDSGSPGLRGIAGSGSESWIVYPDLSVDAEFSGTITCEKPSPPRRRLQRTSRRDGADRTRAANTLAISTHLHAQTDAGSFTPGCSFGGPMPDCNSVHYEGTGTYTGDLDGTLEFSGYGYLRDDGKVGSREDSNLFTGTVAGCGTGTFRYKAEGVFNGVDPAAGGLVGEETLDITRGTGSGGLSGLSGSAIGAFVANADGSLDVDYTGRFDCPKKKRG